MSGLHTTDQAPLPHFAVEGLSAGSYTGAVVALAIHYSWPDSEITARLGAIAMPRARWMGGSKHKCWHWLHCRLPVGILFCTSGGAVCAGYAQVTLVE